jgi:hypothetical protein
VTGTGKKSAARKARREAALKKTRRRRIVILSVVGLGIVAVIAFALTRPTPEELVNVETFGDMGGGHLAAGETPPDYNSSPPTSGRHSPTAAQCGIYASEVPDSIQVHNLEHGTVIIQYQPDLPETEVELLRGYARSKPGHILVATRSDLSDAVVVTSWRRMLRLDSVDLDTIDVYYGRFVRTGPEVGVPCVFAVDESA